MRLTKKVALVTGGGGGIGEATARRFVAEGARVAVVDVDAAAAQRAAAAIDPAGETIFGLGADLTRQSECDRAVAETVARFGALQILINVAGIRVPPRPVTEADEESWQLILGVNLLATAFCSKAAIPAIARAGGGSIVHISSGNALAGRAGWAQYDATKAALLALMRDMAVDHAPQNIRVNAILPGPTRTRYHIDRALARGLSEEEHRLEFGRGTILGRPGEPEEVAAAICFLASDDASFITGVALPVDGGFTAL